jgi:iron complex transport system substrate-binding protein
VIRIFGYIWLLIRIQVLLTTVKLFTCRFQVKEKLVQNIVLSKTDVVKNDRIYIIPNGLLGGDKSYLGAQYLAKWFYPDQFKELDPDKVLKEYFEKWLDVPFQGKWAYPPSTK